jgi:hypothetical protein
MTSALSLADIEDALVSAGVRSPYIRQRILRLVEQYAQRYAIPEYPEEEEIVPDPPRYEYKCPECKEKKDLKEFPERKAEHRRTPVPCLACS